MDNLVTNDDEDKTDDIYKKIASQAKDNGIVVNVITIKGEDCKLERLGMLADLTNGKFEIFNGFSNSCAGNVDVVDPLKLDFNSVLENPVIATNTKLKFVLHQGLKFKNELNVEGNQCTRDIGNVTVSDSFSRKVCIYLPFRQIQMFHLPFN